MLFYVNKIGALDFLMNADPYCSYHWLKKAHAERDQEGCCDFKNASHLAVLDFNTS